MEHKQTSRKRIDSYINEIVELEHKLKDFQIMVYKTGESINTIQKFTVNPNSQRLGLGDDKPHFLKRTLPEIPKLYSAEQLFNDQIKCVIVYDREEE